jgi:glycosyltransferase involved in cell wall biosynthesis
MPAYNRPDVLARTLESLFSQTFRDFALVIVDDCPSAETAAIVETYARECSGIHYETNDVRLGMVGNWRKVFARARERYPESAYFAWVSDHDVWHARWLQELVSVLDEYPGVVLAYPMRVRMLPGRSEIEKKTFDTFGLVTAAQRMRHAALNMPAGDVIYGLMRIEALEAAGVFRHLLTPDRQVLLALSMLGQFKQVPEVLWYREIQRGFDIARQREVFFTEGAPLYVYLPSHLQHCATLLWDFAAKGRGRPMVGRVTAIRCAMLQLWLSSVRQFTLPKASWRMGSIDTTASGALDPQADAE